MGGAANRISDKELLETINTLDLLAVDALEKAKREIQIKAHANDMSNLIYDIYRDKKSKGVDRL